MCSRPKTPKIPPTPKSPPVPEKSAAQLGRSEGDIASQRGPSTLRRFSIRFSSPFQIPD